MKYDSLTVICVRIWRHYLIKTGNNAEVYIPVKNLHSNHLHWSSPKILMVSLIYSSCTSDISSISDLTWIKSQKTSTWFTWALKCTVCPCILTQLKNKLVNGLLTVEECFNIGPWTGLHVCRLPCSHIHWAQRRHTGRLTAQLMGLGAVLSMRVYLFTAFKDIHYKSCWLKWKSESDLVQFHPLLKCKAAGSTGITSVWTAKTSKGSLLHSPELSKHVHKTALVIGMALFCCSLTDPHVVGRPPTFVNLCRVASRPTEASFFLHKLEEMPVYGGLSCGKHQNCDLNLESDDGTWAGTAYVSQICCRHR